MLMAMVSLVLLTYYRFLRSLATRSQPHLYTVKTPQFMRLILFLTRQMEIMLKPK